MELSGGFPMWDKLTAQQQETLTRAAAARSVKRGELLHGGSGDCLGLLVVRQGQLRAYILSEEGREITLYRLFQRDICLFSAACAMGSMQMDIAVEAEKDTDFFRIPPEVYLSLIHICGSWHPRSGW